MSRCKICEKEFKSNWHLQRHLSRKIPCKQNVINVAQIVSNTDSTIPNDMTKVKIDTGDQPDILDSINEKLSIMNNVLKCKYCEHIFSTQTNFNKHSKKCKEEEDIVRCLELQLDIKMKKPENRNCCRFCKKIFSRKNVLNKHIQNCPTKKEYRKYLEEKLKSEKTTPTQQINQTTNNTINVNISAEALQKFGQENTDHITNAYLLKVIGRLGVTLPTVVSTVAKQIYCDSKKPENQTIQITNVRSQWQK